MGNFQGAVDNFTECLGLDDLNDAYNATILYNRASAYHKLKDFKKAMNDCDSALKLNPEYGKVYVKKGDIYLDMEEFEEACRMYDQAKKVEPGLAGLREKIHKGKIELKKSKRKDFYKVLGVTKDATEKEIQKAYKKSALRWHPDKHQQDTEEE